MPESPGTIGNFPTYSVTYGFDLRIGNFPTDLHPYGVERGNMRANPDIDGPSWHIADMGSEQNDDGPARLADTVSRRRKWLRLSQEDVANAGGPSAKTIYAIEQGVDTSLRPSTLRRLDVGLAWRAGTAQAIYDGHVVGDELDDAIMRATAPADLADRVGSAYVPPLGAGLRAVTGRPSPEDSGAARVAATLDAMIAADHERLQALLDEGKLPGDLEVEEVLARLVQRAEQRRRLG
jgi:hypothetical protein